MIDVLSTAVDTQKPTKARGAAIQVGFAALDLQLRHRPPATIDLARCDLWAHRVLVDVAADDLGAVTGDVATLEWIRDRFVHILDPSTSLASTSTFSSCGEPRAMRISLRRRLKQESL